MTEKRKGPSAAAKKKAAETRMLKRIKVPGVFVLKGKVLVNKDQTKPDPA